LSGDFTGNDFSDDIHLLIFQMTLTYRQFQMKFQMTLTYKEIAGDTLTKQLKKTTK